ncbi:MAG: preprotein translocase subunit SecA [Christensenellales bacterium]|jgi:preprotein translocase subunit SecA
MGLFSQNSRNIKKLKKIADKVVALEEEFSKLTDEELKAKTPLFLSRLEKGETLNDILPEAYATVREAAFRVLNMKHFYVQILGGIALHQGRIAEMATGEGKTLVATLPSYLNALSKKGVHVVTVNEYLAKRDAEWMGKVHKFLGLTVGVAVSGMSPKEKQEAYACDITYGTNNEFGFDYLRDNMVIKASDRMQRGHNFAIVDEVDSILIDEARTPLIISGAGMKSSKAYYDAQNFARSLKDEEHFEIDPKLKTIHLTEEGIAKAERFYKIENLSDVEHIELNHYIMNALKANYIMHRDENYIVKDDEIIIVDEFTGRLMPGRRYSDGLHQAIEAKENVKIKDENKTLATVTFQNYFRLYRKLSGMTGTAKTEEAEFNGIYSLDVIIIPPNKPNQRIDEPDIIYKNVRGKLNAVVEEVKDCYEKGQPVLIGTITIEKSEEISRELKKAKIPHYVLNAKNHEQESEIVAQAGRFKAVTIATNMAGRGTDILLGGNPEFLAKNRLRAENVTDAQISFATSFETNLSEEMQEIRARYNRYYKEFKVETDKEKEKVLAVGGLHIVGTERHESRRIDNQLRGRASRQGDPGSTVFFLSLEDDLLKRFGGEKMQKITEWFRIDENTPFQLKLLSKQIEGAQKRVESQNYASRRSVLEFDNVMNKQREIIYGERNKVLDGEDVHNQVMAMFPDIVSPMVYSYLNPDKPYYEWDLEPLNRALEDNLFPKGTNLITKEFVDDCEIEDVVEKILKVIYAKYDEKLAITNSYKINFADFERFVLLRVVDSLWMDHIDQMTILRNEIGLRAYGNQDPIVAYKREGFDMFDNMIDRIKLQTASLLLNAKIEIETKVPERKQEYKPIEVTEGSGPAKQEKLTGRNDPCPCGSGQKYKNCHGKNV